MTWSRLDLGRPCFQFMAQGPSGSSPQFKHEGFLHVGIGPTRTQYRYMYWGRTPKMRTNIYLAFRTIRTICSAFLHYAYQFPTTYYIPWPFFCIVYVPQHFQSNWGAIPHTHMHALHAVANVVQLGRYPIHAFACAPCCSKRSAIGTLPHTRIGVRSILCRHHIGARLPLATPF